MSSEHRLNWHKAKRFFQSIPNQSDTMVYLTADKKVKFGISMNPNVYFHEVNISAADLDSIWDYSMQRYQAKGQLTIDRDEFLHNLRDIISIHKDGPATDAYHQQMQELYERWNSSGSARSRWIQQRGIVDSIWQRDNFFLTLFSSWAAELLPTKKYVVLGIVQANDKMQTLVLEFKGKHLVKVLDPDWDGLDFPRKKTQPAVARMLSARVEKQFKQPAYVVLLSNSIWQEANQLFREHSVGAAWRLLRHEINNKKGPQEVVVEPNSWLFRLSIWLLGFRS